MIYLECTLKPGQACPYQRIVRLSEESRCLGCRHVRSSQADELASNQTPRRLDGHYLPRPAAVNLGGYL